MTGVLHPACGKRFPPGDRTGHGSGCCATLYGLAAFDRHQSRHDDRVRCSMPSTDSGEWRLDQEGRWHYGERMTPEQAAALWGAAA